MTLASSITCNQEAIKTHFPFGDDVGKLHHMQSRGNQDALPVGDDVRELGEASRREGTLEREQLEENTAERPQVDWARVALAVDLKGTDQKESEAFRRNWE